MAAGPLGPAKADPAKQGPTLKSNWRRYRDALAAAHGYSLRGTVESSFGDSSFGSAAQSEASTKSRSVLDLGRLTRVCIIGIFVIMLFTVLKISRPLSLPIVSGIVLALFLGRMVDWLSDLGLPRTLAAGLVSLMVAVLMVAAAAMLAAPFALWFDQIPAMAQALRARLDWLFDLFKQIETMAGGAAPPGASRPVVINEGSSGPILEIALSSTAALAGFGLAMLTMFFVLTSRRTIKARALRLCLGRDARRSAGEFFDRIEQRVAHYVSVVTVINAIVGCITAGIVMSFGLPFAAAWGALAAIMNYIPVIGPLIVAVSLLAAGLVAFPDSLLAVAPAASYFLVHLAEGQLITPALVGRRLLLSPALVFLSFAFWLWLWGPVGAILATPLLLILTSAWEVLSDSGAIGEAPSPVPDAAEAEAAVAPPVARAS